LDLVLIRENTEGEYSGLEHETVPGVIESLKVFWVVIESKELTQNNSDCDSS
jgi:isocitrate/isopropylmalate dehydrogenase